MRKLVFFGCGQFGPTLLDSAVASGVRPDPDTFALDGSDIHAFRKNLDSICNTVYNKDSMLLLCDTLACPITQEACLVLEKRGLINRMILMAGANVPAALAAIAFKDRIESDEQLQQILKAEASSGIQFIGR